MEHNTEKEVKAEKPNAFWNRVYLAVIVSSLLVMAALWTFSRHFS